MFTLSDRAIAEIAKAGETQEFTALRISAESAGCSGLRYSLNVELAKNEDDLEFNAKAVTVLLNPSSLALLEGATLEFSEEEGGFVFNNPNADTHASCSCHSESAQECDSSN